MKQGERDEFGRLNVPHDDLVANARGAMVAACVSVESVMRLLGCNRCEAEHFQECAHADLSRLRLLGRGR